MTNHKKRKIYFGIFWTFLIVSFLFFACLVILMANGYHLNWKTMRLQQTGMFVLGGNQNNVKLKINNTEKAISLPYKIKRLLPGRYEILLEKTNYQNWSKVYELNGGQAVITNAITMYLVTPEITKQVTTENNLKQLPKDYESQKNGLLIKDYELYNKDKLITRFSQPVEGAIYDTNSNHIYYQTGNQLRVMEADGSNNQLLITIKQNSATPFVVDRNKIKFIDQSEIFEAIIY